MDNLFTPWRTPGGVRFLLAPLPWRKETLALWNEAWAWEGWPAETPMMSPGEALAYLEAAEDAHARHGFFALSDWRGLNIPEACPIRVALDLQACFLASAYAQGGAR